MRTLWLRVAMVAALVFVVIIGLTREQATVKVGPARTSRWWGTITDVRASGGEARTYVLDIDGIGRVLASLQSGPIPGTRICVRGRMEPLDDARNPFEPSEQSIEAEHHVVARIESAHIMAVDPRTPRTFDAMLAQTRANALTLLRKHLGEPYASIVAGELWGERSAMAPDLRTEFSETGTVHVLVTAGLHVGLIAWLVLALMRLLTVPRVTGCLIAVSAVWAFAIFSGPELPALRAATMATVALGARASGRAALSWHGLAVGAIVVLAVLPHSLTSASFWLSFCCVGAIFVCASPIEAGLRRFAMPAAVREALVLTVATQLGTWPITAAVFLQFAPYALLANLVVVPCVPVTMILAALQLATTPVSPLAQAFANLNSWPLLWMTSTVHLLSSAPFASIPMTPAPMWCIALYEAALIPAMWLFRRRIYTAALAVLLFAMALVLAPPRPFDTRLRITVLDVGQADAIAIETPTHHAILVDAGGRLERGSSGEDSVAEAVGTRIVVPFLLRSGIHALDALIISHPHGDHAGGCAPVLRKIRIAEIADSGQTYGGHAYQDCLDTAGSDHVPIVHPRAGDVWRTNDGVTLTFIGPSLPFIGGRNAINDNSIAFILQYRRFRMLFTGDAGVVAEQRFLSEGIDLSSTVLKVGHHGSAYSSSPEFIAAVHPKYAIISVGRHNMFGHPAPSTIEKLEVAQIGVYRTDEDSAVIVTTDGYAYSIHAMSRSRIREPVTRL